jgi:hypothetical protein
MEHAIHCASWAFINTVCPTPMASIMSKLAADEDNTLELIGETMASTDTTDPDDLLDTEEFDPTNLLGKVLAFINQVHSSLQARTSFHKLCKDKNLPPLQLLKWVHTHWASLYDLITCLLDVHPACNKFTLLTDDDDRVLNLKFPKTYVIFKLNESKWHLLELIRDGLKELALSCQSFSHATQPTVYCTFSVLESMMQRWEHMVKSPKYVQIVPTLKASLDNLCKWYRILNESSIYFICLILDPCVKMAYFQMHWEEEYMEAGRRSLEKTMSHQFHRVPIYITEPMFL